MVPSTPYWWEEAPPASPPQVAVQAKCDVVIVGAGYTGLSAGLTLARAGRRVQIFDRQRPGEGASTRNGGIASGNLRPSYRQMMRRFGEARATAIQAEAKAAREDLAEFIGREAIDCEFRLTGRFTGAAKPGEYEGLAREADLLRKTLGIEAYAVPRSEQRNVLGTEFYHGGMVRNDIGGLHPAKFHRGMLALAEKAGAIIHSARRRCSALPPSNGGFEVETARGRVQADHVIVGTNGYTDGVDPWLRRRLVPVRSRIIATAPLSNNLMAELMPKRVMCSETRKLHYYYRPSPDGTRILFGGRDGTIAGDPDLADRQPEPRAGRYLPRARRRRHHAQLVRPCRHEPRHDPARLLAPRHALRGGLLRLGRRVGALGRTEGGMAGARRRARPLSARLPPAADHPALQRQALVPAGGLRLDDPAGPRDIAWANPGFFKSRPIEISWHLISASREVSSRPTAVKLFVAALDDHLHPASRLARTAHEHDRRLDAPPVLRSLLVVATLVHERLLCGRGDGLRSFHLVELPSIDLDLSCFHG